MLKSLRAGLKGLLGPATDPPREPPTAPHRTAPSEWFCAARRRIEAGDTAVAGEVRAALEGAPDSAEAQVLQAEIERARHAPADAARRLARAIDLSPGLAEAHAALGAALADLGHEAEAHAAFDRALALAHDLAPAHVGLGRLHEARGEAEDAADCYNLALAFDKNAIDARLGLCRLMCAAGQVEQGVEELRRLAAAVPAHAPAHFELARGLNRAGDTAGAIGAYERALALAPGYADACVNLGMIYLAQLGDARRAESLFRQAARDAPQLVAAQANLGLALQEQGRLEEALRHYEEQIARSPGVVELRWNRGIACLAAGDYARGWEDFELRKQRPDAGGVHQKFPYPDWDGNPLEGRSILVYGEQGLGDEVMFGSCLPEVVAAAKLCVIECDARLGALYRRSFPAACVEPRGADRARDWRTAYPQLELQAAVGSLPRHLRASLAEFPSRKAYLAADPEAVARWRERLDRLGPGPKVGISWRGGTRRTRADLRSLEAAELRPLLERTGAGFVTLQRDAREDERALIAAAGRVLDPGPIADIDELAALLAALDVLVSVDNTNVHLAGALGRPVWALLGESPEWRYGMSGSRMPWYPSVSLLRRAGGERWDAVVARAGRMLDQRLAEGGDAGHG